MQSISKDPNLVFQLGNDEFAIVLPTLNSPNIISFSANKVIEALKKPFIYKEDKIVINFNLGCSATNLRTDNELLMLVPEHSLAQAKQQNKTIHVADIKSELFGHADLSLLNDFKEALHDNELELHYQPKIHLTNPDLLHAEA